MAYKIIETCIGCTACTKRCPTEAITGVRNVIHQIDPELCIDCGACGVVCPPEAILDELGDVSRTSRAASGRRRTSSKTTASAPAASFASRSAPSTPWSSTSPASKVGDFFGVASVIERRCTGCRLCEQSCGWSAIYIDPPREMQKKLVWPEEEAPEEAAEPATADA